MFKSRPLRPEDLVICFMLGIRCRVRKKDRLDIASKGRSDGQEEKFKEKPMRKGRIVIRLTDAV